MNNWFWLNASCILFAVCVAVAPMRGVSAQDRPPNTVESGIAFERPPIHRKTYGGGKYGAYYNSDGGFSIQGADFLRNKYQFTLEWGGVFATGDIVGVLGGVFRASCGDKSGYFERIADKDLPKGVKVPDWDSLAVPLTGHASFWRVVGFQASKISGDDPMKAEGELVLTLYPSEKKQTATVKPGDYLLVASHPGKEGPRGHLVRAIIPANRKTRVVGWVEISPEPVPEADLVRGKKPIVRPETVKDRIDFAPPPKGKWGHLAGIAYNAKDHGDGSCTISGSNPPGFVQRPEMRWEGKFKPGDVVAVLGGVFRANFEEKAAYLERIPEKEFPKGIKDPEADSLIVPLTGQVAIQHWTKPPGVSRRMDVVKFEASKILGADHKDPKAELRLTLYPSQEKQSATVKTGDYILVVGQGYLVRAIVPPDRKTRVVGWIELSPEPIPEADLIRDKKALVRPMPKKEEK